jgi:catechol 2,3-dioxygenase-like lactoylglutathione lyase family enzyme
LQIHSPEPGELAAFYARALGMTVEPHAGEWICRGPQRRLIMAPGPAGTLGFAAYAISDWEGLQALKTRLIAADATFDATGSPLFEPGALTVTDPDGNRTVFGIPLAESIPMPAMTARLQHVVLASTDAAKMSAFYQDVIGFTLSDEVLDDNGDLRTAFVRSDFEHHSLAVFQASECRLDHHCYEAADWNSIRDWGDHFAAIRVPLVWGPGRHGPGNNLFIFVHDLDGNWIEISAELEIVEAGRKVGAWPHEERTLNTWGRGLLRS